MTDNCDHHADGSDYNETCILMPIDDYFIRYKHDNHDNDNNDGNTMYNNSNNDNNTRLVMIING